MQEEDQIEAIIWGRNYLRSQGYELMDNVDIVRNMPWSCVSRIETEQGNIYLKSMSQAFANEPVILEFIHNNLSQNVTEIIASNNSLSCFLMKDAGIPLRNILEVEFHHKILSDSVKICADIQLLSMKYIDKLLALGVTDWRVDRIPALYQEFLAQETLLLDSGITLNELDKLHNLTAAMQLLCKQLSEYNISDALEHCDFSDSNILIDNSKIVISDWGDAVITHPFFSCVSALKSIENHYNLAALDKRYLLLKDHILINGKIVQVKKSWLKYLT